MKITSSKLDINTIGPNQTLGPRNKSLVCPEMKYLAKAVGIEETIKSPTFVIMKIYDLTPRFASPSPCQGEGKGEVYSLIHIDAYRIEKEEEMLNLGWQEIISDPRNLICIEWADKIAGIMPSHIVIKFEHVDESSRRINIKL